MKIPSILIVVILLISVGFLFGNEPIQKVNLKIDAGTILRAESGCIPENPPPIDSLCLVFSGVDYGGNFDSPQAYPNAKHITNVKVGSYYFPVVIWQMGTSWGEQSVFSYWDDLFKFWSYPDSFTSSQSIKTGRTGVCADSKGNLHFSWYQTGNPDGYEVYYTRAFLDTSAGIIQYSVERPAVMVTPTNGEYDWFGSIACSGDTLIMIVWTIGLEARGIGYNYSTDGGDTWLGPFVLYDHGGTMPSAWQLNSLAPDPNTENMWMSVSWDYTGDGRQDIVAYHWDAATNTWTDELAAETPGTTMHPYSLPTTVVDYNSIPHIIFQQNLVDDGGVNGGLTGWNQCGPAGTLYYIHRSGGSWSTPKQIMFPTYEINNYEAGFPSAGIATDNTIYFSTTQPDSATPDTNSAYFPFDVHYAEISPYTGAVSYGGIVSVGDTTYNAIYGQTPQFVPIEGPGITWSQMYNAVPPTDIYYRHCDTLVAVRESKTISHPSPVTLYQNYPNPANGKTMIRFTVPSNTFISLDIYDISGRLVKTLAKGVPGAGSYFVVWDGKDLNGKEAPGGVYLYTLRAGSYTETRKLLLVH
ncbi:MAG: T9SS type A sorting domain-containing protein [Candidatus Cloacimonadota bacterium]|nr:MAG: T9SS type A sorting domain-containing protein [Candidatus Cloacimonadota bacterium]